MNKAVAVSWIRVSLCHIWSIILHLNWKPWKHAPQCPLEPNRPSLRAPGFAQPTVIFFCALRTPLLLYLTPALKSKARALPPPVQTTCAEEDNTEFVLSPSRISRRDRAHKPPGGFCGCLRLSVVRWFG